MRGFVLAIVGSLSLLSPAGAANRPAAELLARQGEEFLKSASTLGDGAKAEFTAAELVEIAARLAAEDAHLPKDHQHRHLFGRYFERACQNATGAELTKLIEVYVAIDPAEFDKQWLLPRLAAAWVREYLANAAELEAVDLPPLTTATPPALADAPQELIAAWQLYRSAVQPFDATFRRDDRHGQAISFQMNKRSFYALIDNVLQGEGDQLPEKLAAFQWSGWCGTGSDSLEEPQAIAMFLALLRDGRIAGAVGAAIHLGGDHPMISVDGRQNARIEFLKQCGLDWEAILAGAQLASEVRSDGGPWQEPTLAELAAFSSDRGAALIAQMARRAPRDRSEAYAAALSTLVPGDDEAFAGASRSSREIDRSPDLTISAETKANVVAALYELATPNASSDLVKRALRGIARAKLPESKPTLRALLKHRSGEVTKAAAQILRSLGEDVAPVAAAGPVRFRFSLDGATVPEGTEIGWKVEYGAGGSTSSSKEADKSGVIAIARETFLDSERQPSAVVFNGAKGKDPAGQPYFHVTLPVPTNLDTVTAVDVDLTPVELRVDRFHLVPDNAKRTATVEIQRHEPPRDASAPYSYFDRAPWSFDVPLQQPVRLLIQSRGTYDVSVLCAGAEKHTSTFTVGVAATRLSVVLKPGGDVRAEVVRPDGEEVVRATVLHAGKEVPSEHFDWRTRTWQGLPIGDYVLHIPSSAEAYPSTEMGRDRTPLVAYRGRDIPFAITGERGAALDLGKIQLEAVE